MKLLDKRFFQSNFNINRLSCLILLRKKCSKVFSPPKSPTNSNVDISSSSPPVLVDYLDRWLGNDLHGERYLKRFEREFSIKRSEIESTNGTIESSTTTLDGSDHASKLHEISLVNVTINDKWLNAMILDVTFPKISENESSLDIVPSSVLETINFEFNRMHNNAPNSQNIVLNLCILPEFDHSFTDAQVNLLSRVIARLKVDGINVLGIFKNDIPITLDLGSLLRIFPNDEPRPQSAQLDTKPAMVHRGVVRSGQQIYAEGRSLIIYGAVNSGGEVIADGDVHIYGPLKGRAVAGLADRKRGSKTGSESGQSSNMFVGHFDPVLVGIGDSFVVPEELPVLSHLIGKSVSISKDIETATVSSVVVDCEEGRKIVITPVLF